jgi:hypothetical protein
MYKKITHNIVEEHYDHPMAAKIKAGLKPTITRKAMRDYGNDDDLIFGRPTAEIFNKNDFTARFESYLANYTQKLIQITDATAGTEEQLVTAFEDLFNFVDQVGDFFDPFYNRELGERVTNSFRNIASNITMIVHTTKAGWSTEPWARLLNQSTFIANFQQYNDNWPRPNLENIMKVFISDMIARATAIKAGNQSAVDQLTNNMYSTIMLWKDAIVNGITQQFPQRFTT